MSVIQRVGEQDVVLVDRLVPPTQEELIVFVRALRTALLSYNLYPPGHSVTRRRMGEFIQHLMPLFKGVDVLVIVCKRDGFEVNDTQILQSVPERDVARELSSFFELRGLRNIVIQKDVSFEELEQVFTRWVKKSEDSRTMQTAWLEGLHTPSMRFNMTMANRSEMVIQDGVSGQPLEITREALQDAMAASQQAVQGVAFSGHPQTGLERGGGRPTMVTTRPQTGSQPHLAHRSGWFGEEQVPPQGQHHRTTGNNPQIYSTQERAWGQAPQIPPHSRTPPGGHGYGSDYAGQAGPPPTAAYRRQPQGPGRGPDGRPFQPGPHGREVRSDELYGQPAGIPPRGQPTQNARRPSHHHRSGHYGPPLQAIPTEVAQPAAAQGGSSRRGADIFQTGKFQPLSPETVAAHAQQVAQPRQPAPQGQGGSRGADAFQTGQYHPFAEEALQGHLEQSRPRQTPADTAASHVQARGQSGVSNAYTTGSQLEQAPDFQPFNPFSSDQMDASGQGGRRGADMFGTGQFGSDMQERLRALHEGPQSREMQSPVRQPEAAPSPQVAMEHITIDPEAFDRRPPPFAKLDYRQIDPISLFKSRRFQAFLAHGGSGHYLSVFVPPHGAIERHIGGGVMGQRAWLGTPPSRSLLKAVGSLPDPQLKQRLMVQLAQIVASGNSNILEEQLMQLGNDKPDRVLRSEILRHTSQARVAEMGQRMLRRMVRANDQEEFVRAGQLLQPLIELQRRRNDWTPLVAVLESLKRLRWDARSEPWIREQSKQMISLFVPPRTGQQLLYQALCGEGGLREQARYGLIAMGVDAAPIFIESLRQLKRRKDLEAMYGLLQDVSRQLSTQQKRLFYGRLWAERAPLDGHQQIVLLKGMQQNAPDTLETFLLKEIRFAEEQGQEDVLLNCARHAILFHTPGLRQVLADLFRSRRFALHQEMEENILKILDKHKTIAAIPLLDEMIHDVKLDIALRASAVWLLGSLKRPESLELLGQILTARKRFWRQPKYKKELRLQVLDTFRHFEWQGIKPLLEKAAKDPDREIKRYASQMLEEDRGFTFLST